MLPEGETDEGTAELKERQMDLGQPVIPDAQAAEAAQPREVAFRHPPIAAEPLATLDAAPRDARCNAASPARLPTVPGIIALIGVQLGRPPTGAPEGALDRWHGVQHRRQGERVGTVSRAQADRQRDPLAVVEDMVLRARPPAIRRIPAGDLAPLFAGTRRLSRLARDQSIRSALPN